MAKVSELKSKSRVGVSLPERLYYQVVTGMNQIKITLFYLIVLSALSGCQQEVDEIKLPLPAEAFTANSNEADLIRRTSLRDGSSDNILDYVSCTSLVLPVTILLNGQEIIVTTKNDLKYIERIIDEADDDDDIVNFIFPVTVILADHSQILIENEEAFEDLVDDCIEGGEDDDIECIDFQYPIKIAVYNTNNQVSNVITITSDAELYGFIEALEEGELVSFKFPVIMKLLDGTDILVYDNNELEDAIEDAVDDCDEDDDNDFDDDDVDDSYLVSILLDGSWRVDYFFDEADETSKFANFTFTFYANGTALATNGITNAPGIWKTYGDDGELELVLDFGEDSPFDEIEEDWKVDQLNEMTLTLKDDKEEGSAKTLVLKKL